MASWMGQLARGGLETKINLSFPRKREPSGVDDGNANFTLTAQRLRGDVIVSWHARAARFWFPAFAGMTNLALNSTAPRFRVQHVADSDASR